MCKAEQVYPRFRFYAEMTKAIISMGVNFGIIKIIWDKNCMLIEYLNIQSGYIVDYNDLPMLLIIL